MREQMDLSDASLSDALRKLPLQAPAADAWSRLAAELAPPARTHRRAWQFAAAAAVLIAIGALLTMPHRPPATVSPVATSTTTSTNTAGNANVTTTDTHQLIALQTRSRDLEQWLHQTAGAAAPLPGSDLAAATEIENLIGIVDVQLASPDRRDAEKLWHRRVDLLEDLTALRYSNYRLAESDSTSGGQPATWIN